MARCSLWVYYCRIIRVQVSHELNPNQLTFLLYIGLVIKIMKKKNIDPNNKIYRITPLPYAPANELKLKQIYDTALKSREKTPRGALKRQSFVRNQVPLTDNKPEPNRTNRYRAYLQNEVLTKVKANRRYSRKNEKEDEQNPYMSGVITSRHERNDSVDMFKIRKSKVNSSHKVSASSYTRLQQGPGEFESAKNMYKQGKFAEALQIAQPFLQKDSRNQQYQYYTAIIHLNLHNYEKGLQLLQRVCRNHPQYKKTAFLFAAISAKNLNELEKARRLCTWGLQRYQGYTDLMLYRANISELQNNYEEAHKDYQAILANDKNNVKVLMKNAECLFKIGAYNNCLSNLAAAVYSDKSQTLKEQILTRRIEIFLSPQCRNLKQAKKDLSKLMVNNASIPQVLYLKGLILQAQGFRKQSILSFEQCLKQGCSKQTMSKALIQIVKNKIDDRDFYSASYHINRSKYFQLDGEDIHLYKLFSEGVVHLMKRKVTEGDQNFTKLLLKYPNLTPYLKTIFYLYRAFAKFSLSQYAQAIQCYELANKEQPLDIFAKYNKQLAQGIVEVNNKNYEKGIEYFNTAQKTISMACLNKIEPNLYRGAAHIQMAKDLMTSSNDMEQLKSLQQIFSGLKELDKAYDINDSNSNMLYYRGMVYLYLGKYDEALQDIIKAISKSEENVAKYFFFRAITQCSLNNTKQALNDFNICNNLDDKFTLVYLERAKLHFANENVTKGLEDLMKLKNLDPKEDIKYHQACLNYFNNHFIMASACCDQIVNQQKARQIKVLIKTKLGKIKQAKKLATSKADLMIYDIIQGKTDVDDVPSTDLQFFSVYHYHHYLAIKQFRAAQYAKALDIFTMAGKERNLYDLQQGIASNSLNQQQQQQQDNDQDNDKDAMHRINYNIFLCHLQMREWKKAYEVFIRDVIGVNQSFLKNQFIASFSHLLFQAIKQSKNSDQPQEKQMYELNLYDSKLDRILPQIVIQLPNFIMKTRLCLLGLINKKLEKTYKAKANPDFILNYMTMSEIQNRPQPPWVKREQSGLIFTDDIQNINIQFQTTQNDEDEDQQGEDGEEQDEEQEEGQSQEDDDQQQEQQQSQGTQKISLRKFKQKMKLDDSIERKLQKIMQRKNKNANN